MGLRMKNFDILGVHWKIWLLGEFQEKLIYRGVLPKKGRLGQFVDLRGAWQERGGGVFEGGGGVDTPIHTMINHVLLIFTKQTTVVDKNSCDVTYSE